MTNRLFPVMRVYVGHDVPYCDLYNILYGVSSFKFYKCTLLINYSLHKKIIQKEIKWFGVCIIIWFFYKWEYTIKILKWNFFKWNSMIFNAELMKLVTTKMYQDIYANNLEKYFNLNFMKLIV